MIDVILSNHARNLLRAAALAPTFKEVGHRNENGEWVEPMSEETVERLRSHQLPGESDSDTVERLFAPKAS
jgi:hypothetical protein